MQAENNIVSKLTEPLLSPNVESLEQTEKFEEVEKKIVKEEDGKSRNIGLILAYTLVSFISQSIWSQNVLSTFVYLLRNDNPESVGFITAIMGISMLLVSFPTGIYADCYRRDKLLKLGSIVGIAASIILTMAVFLESYILLTVSLAIHGFFRGIVNTSSSALFADSICDGDRSYYLTKRSIMTKLGNTAGPVTSIILFSLLGDKWSLKNCSVVIVIGQVLFFLSTVFLCFLSDDQIVKEEKTKKNNLHEENMNLFDETKNKNKERVVCFARQRTVPILIALSDCLTGFASGMSIRYFPIFFVDNLKLSPVKVQILYVVSPLAQAILMRLGQVISKKTGRCRIAAINKWIGISCMFIMIYMYIEQFPVWLVLIFYIIRTSFMNSTGALTKSVLMDSVPKHERGKWSALESVNTFSWSGSAFLGGMLVGSEGIIFNFCITASLQLVGTIPLVLLFSKDKLEGKVSIVKNNVKGKENHKLIFL